MSPHFVLASASPRRREFLEQLNIPLTVISPGKATLHGEIDETPLPHESPTALVQRLSRIKAEAISQSLPELLPNIQQAVVIIAADTVVVLEGKILGKPHSPDEATHMLQSLREEAHYVYSGLTIAYVPQISPTAVQAETVFITCLHKSQVWMRPYSQAEIAAYVAGGSPLDKAGAYGIQDKSFAPVQQWQGCFASIMGLPLAELKTALAQLKVSLPETAPICAQYTRYCCQYNN